MTLAWILAACLAGSLLSLGIAALAAFHARPRWIPALVSYAVGALLGVAFLDLLPHIFHVARNPERAAGFAEQDLDRWFLPAESPRATHVLDMWRSNRDQLVAAGLDPANVHVAGLCTATHNDWFWSYRREGARAGRMLGVIRRA